MKESEKVTNFCTRVEIVYHIESLGDTIQSKNMIKKFAIKFKLCVVAIEESKDLSKLSLHELMSSLQAHEQRIDRTQN